MDNLLYVLSEKLDQVENERGPRFLCVESESGQAVMTFKKTVSLAITNPRILIQQLGRSVIGTEILRVYDIEEPTHPYMAVFKCDNFSIHMLQGKMVIAVLSGDMLMDTDDADYILSSIRKHCPDVPVL